MSLRSVSVPRVMAVVSMSGDPYPIARRIEIEGIDQRQRNPVARGETVLRISQRDDPVFANPHMEMILVAEMLDPLDLAHRRAIARLGNAQMLGAGADGLRALGRGA